jgi:hypothetical protein
VGVDHRAADVLVAEQFLNGADVVTLLQQAGGKRVTEDVARGRLDPGGVDRVSLLDRRVMAMPATLPFVRAPRT